ncbi:hypothetical protein F4703DRAFT_1855595 [Phycomyces blakesleeanus]
MYKFILLLLLLVSFEMTIALPNLSYIDTRAVAPGGVEAAGGSCATCQEKCYKSADPSGCIPNCCWLCIPGRGGNCHCC